MKMMDELKEYLRIDGDDENQTLSLFLQAAENSISIAGVPVPSDPFLKVGEKDIYASYRLAVLMLATHYYEQRTVITPSIIRGESVPLPYGLQTIILQLKHGVRL
ncbi:head-tail connector protein [Sporosarcina sp. FSL W7-1283]|uniref:head-tail connector protein n=1 Tax=Sporosarcina sp. FSL W7-1283 TaxID=2921560 RepID=UPI0030F7D9AB